MCLCYLTKTTVGAIHVAAFGHIILITIQPIFARAPFCCVHSRESANTNLVELRVAKVRKEVLECFTWQASDNYYKVL